MPQMLAQVAREKSTFAITIAFLDDNSAPMTPNSATFTLSDSAGNIINERDQVTITPLSTSVTIVLSGLDLSISTYGESRVLTIEALYDSSLGSNLPFKDEVEFKVMDLTNIS